MKRVLSTAFLLFGTLALAVHPPAWARQTNREAEKKKVAEVISSVIGWAKDKNLDLFFSSIAQDEDYISVTPGARVIKRFEDVKQNVPFWMSPEFKYVRHELKDLEITFSRGGDVAWFFCILDDINTYKGEPASWENARWTGVVEKRDGKWVVVSQHFSFAQDPAAAPKTPGMTPEIFAPGVVSRDGVQMKLTMTADGSEILYTERDPATNAASFIIRSRAGESWSEPLVPPYSKLYMDIEPCLSPDGMKILFVSNRPASGEGEPGKVPDIWMAEKNAGQWGRPVRLGPPIFTDDPADIEAHPAFLPDGGIYFMRQNGKTRRLFQAARRGDGFAEPVAVPLKEDLLANQFSGPCFSPDGRTLLMHSRKEGGFGNWDLYVAFKDESGGWSELKNLGPAVNTDKQESSPTFSSDGRYLFFTRETDIYWVSAKILDQLRH